MNEEGKKTNYSYKQKMKTLFVKHTQFLINFSSAGSILSDR